MKIEVLLQRNSNIIVHNHVYVALENEVFVVTACDSHVVAYYPVRNVSSITVLD